MRTDLKHNKYFIIECIEGAIKKINKKPKYKDLNFILQEGMRETPGSLPVAPTITDERIPKCDIFIADLSVVNYKPRFIRWGLKKIGLYEGPFQNNSVVEEYGIAYNEHGAGKIIGILNTKYGSPNKNPENIFFDIRYMRFPIEYSSSKIKKRKSEIKQQLISILINAIQETTEYSIEYRKKEYSPFVSWKEWEANSISTGKNGRQILFLPANIIQMKRLI
jgi:hypothetical protein